VPPIPRKWNRTPSRRRLGPFDTAADFYSAYPIALAKSQYGDIWEDGAHGQVVKSFQRAVQELKDDQAPAHGFGLANYDLGAHNYIVDTEFNSLAVIDWDSVLHGFGNDVRIRLERFNIFKANCVQEEGCHPGKQLLFLLRRPRISA
jgi:hypothetical protein